MECQRSLNTPPPGLYTLFFVVEFPWDGAPSVFLPLLGEGESASAIMSGKQKEAEDGCLDARRAYPSIGDPVGPTQRAVSLNAW